MRRGQGTNTPLGETVKLPIPMGERLDLVPLGHFLSESLWSCSKDTLLMYRTPVTITNTTQSDRYLALISQADQGSPLPVLTCSSFSCPGFDSYLLLSPRQLWASFPPVLGGDSIHCGEGVCI